MDENKCGSLDVLQDRINDAIYNTHHNLTMIEQNGDEAANKAQRLVVTLIKSNIEFVENWSQAVDLIQIAVDTNRPKIAAAWKAKYQEETEHDTMATPWQPLKIRMIDYLSTVERLKSAFQSQSKENGLG